ncbi:hypothetical protein [Paludibacterium paludis]|nr:hypothetical protein [Paludibacterium paludis]
MRPQNARRESSRLEKIVWFAGLWCGGTAALAVLAVALRTAMKILGMAL